MKTKIDKNNIFINFPIRKIQYLKKKKILIDQDIFNCTIYRSAKYKKFFFWKSFNEKKLTSKNNSHKKLQNIPFAVKDIFNTKDFPTQMGTPLYENFTPGNDARAVYNLKNNGALVAGKTVTAEFAVHKLNETLNPHNTLLTPGTSSSGSAVAVALGIVPFALGTQTLGSIIRPASFNGIYGFKPTFGLIPRTGVLKTADTLDQIGFFCIHAEDLKCIFENIIVKGKNYPISFKKLKQKKNKNYKGVFFGNLFFDNFEKENKKKFDKFIEKLKANKIKIKKDYIDKEYFKIHEITELIYNKSLSYNFREEIDRDKEKKISSIFKKMTIKGKNIKMKDYLNGLDFQNFMIKKVDNIFRNYDFIISPSTSGPAPRRGTKENKDSCLIWNFLHLPVINVPIFKEKNNLPFGVQIVFPRYKDYQLLDFISFLLKKKLIPKKNYPCLY